MTRRFPNHPRKSIVDDRPIASKTRETARFCLWPFQSCNRSTRMCACPDTGGTSERASSRDVSDRSAPDRDASDRGSERGPLFHPSIVDAPPPTCRKSTPSSVPWKMRNGALDSGDVFAKKRAKGPGVPRAKTRTAPGARPFFKAHTGYPTPRTPVCDPVPFAKETGRSPPLSSRHRFLRERFLPADFGACLAPLSAAPPLSDAPSAPHVSSEAPSLA